MTVTHGRPGGYTHPELRHALHALCADAGLDPEGAMLLRGQTNAVLRLAIDPVVIKIARKGTRPGRVQQTVRLVEWLMRQNFPTAPLHPIDQPTVAGPYVGTFYTYLPQPAGTPTTGDLGSPLRRLHAAGLPPFELPVLDTISAVRRSLAAAETLDEEEQNFLSQRADRLESQLAHMRCQLTQTVLHGDPQHGNALIDHDRTVLCDWDSAVIGPAEWDLVTVEVHARRFGYSSDSYARFARLYGLDVRDSPGYSTLRDLRELRMITTNARKSAHEPEKMGELRRRIDGLRTEDAHLPWSIM